MLTGVMPVDAGKRGNDRLMYKTDPLKVPNEINFDLSFKVTKAIMKGLAMSPKYRSQTVQNWSDLLPNFGNDPSASSQNQFVSSRPNISNSPPVIPEPQPTFK